MRMSCLLAGEKQRCSRGRPHEHHLIPQQLLRRQHSTLTWHGAQVRPLDELLADRRNLVRLCWDHHQLLHNKRLYIRRHQLPRGIGDFARELCLAWYLDNFPEDPMHHLTALHEQDSGRFYFSCSCGYCGLPHKDIYTARRHRDAHEQASDERARRPLGRGSKAKLPRLAPAESAAAAPAQTDSEPAA
jgi:hypothetical protein